MYKLGIQHLNNSFYAVLVDDLNNIALKTKSDNFMDLISEINNKFSNIDIKNIYISTDFIHNKLESLTSIDLEINILIIKITNSKINNQFIYDILSLDSKFKIKEYYLNGALDFYGNETLPINMDQLKKIVEYINNNEIDAIGILGEFSIYYPIHEDFVARYIEENLLRKVPIIKSYEISVNGIIKREIALILNILLIKHYNKYINIFDDILKDYKLNKNLFLINTFGSVIPLSKSKYLPIMLKDSFLSSQINGVYNILKINNFYLLTINRDFLYILRTNNSCPDQIIKKYKILNNFIDIPNIIIKKFNIDNIYNINFFLSNLINKQNHFIINGIKNNLDLPYTDKMLKLNLEEYLGAYGSTVSPYIKNLIYIESLKLKGRQETLEYAKQKCKSLLLKDGVENSTISEVKVEENPISYLTWDILKINVIMKGFLKES